MNNVISRFLKDTKSLSPLGIEAIKKLTYPLTVIICSIIKMSFYEAYDARMSFILNTI